MRRPSVRLIPCVAVAAFMIASPAVGADDAAYVGTWAGDLAQCKTPQDSQDAPLVFSKDGYDQHETHCKFKSADGSNNQWKVTADCTIEGSSEPYDFTLTVSGTTLTVADDTGTRDLLKCSD